MKRHDLQDATGVLLTSGLYPVFVIKTAAPTASAAGFEKGCIYINISGSAGAFVYVNQGTRSSATWLALA